MMLARAALVQPMVVVVVVVMMMVMVGGARVEKCGPCLCERVTEIEGKGLVLNCSGVATPGGALPLPALSGGVAWFTNALEGASFMRLQLRACAAERLLPVPALGVPLRALDLAQNALTTLGDAVLHAHRDALRELSIDDNRLEVLNGDALRELRELYELRVERNHLKELSVSALPPGLLGLYVRSNAIAQLNAPTSTAPQMQLQVLDLSDNALTELDEQARAALVALPELQLLHLSGNPLRTLDGAALLRSAPRLQTLDVSRCGLKQLALGDAQNLALRVLDAAHNALSSAEAVAAVSAFPSLQQLLLGHNGVEDFPISAPHQKLQVLNLTQNSLSSLPSALPKLPALQRLDLSYNDLREVPSRAVGAPSTPALRVLLLDGNEPLASLAFEAPLPNLRVLSAGALPHLRSISANTFSGLRAELPSVPGGNISAACIVTAEGEAPGLSLHLAGNAQLTDVHEDSFKGLPLCEVDLSGCALTSLPKNLVEWKQLRAINLQHNPWDCECDSQWLVDNVVSSMYERGSSQLLYEFRCETPAELRGRRLVHFYDWPNALCSTRETLQRLMSPDAQSKYSLSAGSGMLIALVAVGLIFLGTVIAGLTMHYQSLKKKRRINRRV